MKHARSFTSASSRRKLPILALALLALAYCSIALLTSALATPRSHSAGASSSSAAWLVDRDGAIYSMGGAPDYGSASNQWASPIVGMATTPNDGGYWEVARDGRIYPFGNAGQLRLGEQRVVLAHRGHGGHSRRPGLLGGGRRRPHLCLR